MDLHTPCPHCGNRLNENTPYFTSYTQSAHAPQDELALLNQEVGRLDGIIQQLQQRRSMLLGRINTVQAPIISIPAEVLSQIFLYACPRVVPCKNPGRYPDTAPPSVLTAVCSYWCQTATSTPELWTTVSLDKVAPSTIRDDAAFLKNSFKRAKRYPMSLDLNFVPEDLEDEDGNPMADHLLLELLHEHADRIRSLRICSIPIHWIGAVQWHRFSALIDLRLHWTGGEHQRRDLSKCLSLPNTIKELSILDHPPYDVALRFISPTSITSVDFSKISINQSVQLLAQCPNLLKFSSTNMKTPRPTGAEPNIIGIVTMAHLEELKWEWIDCSWSDAFIRHFRLPVLRKLQWKLCSSTRGNLALEAFWSKLPITVTKLDVSFEMQYSLPGTASLLLQIFRHIPGVVELGVEAYRGERQPNDYSAQSAGGVLRALRVGISGGANDKDDILPSLKVLRWMTRQPLDFYPAWYRSSIDASSLLQMLSTRKKFGLETFKLIWGGDISFKGDHEEKMAELVASGLNIEIIRKWYNPYRPRNQ